MIVVASAQVDETLSFELRTSRTLSADELRAIGDALIQAADKIKLETSTPAGTA